MLAKGDMPNKIKYLGESVVNKIAAGEVIERPASVVKELVENAIDAGSTEIIISIRGGGKDFIQVIDNGFGMSREDALLAFERHATSKIETWEDLQKVKSFGFRGEALASIASVSDMEIRTRPSDEDISTLVHLDAGKVVDVTKEAGPPGTTITVRNLFYSVPARRHFLKTNNTEFRHIASCIKKFAMAYPGVEFTLINEDDKVFQLRPSGLATRLGEVIGHDPMSHTLELESEQFGMRLHGYVSKPSFSFKTKGEQHLFLNGRPITSRTINYAVFSAYGHSLPSGDRPFFVLFLQCPTDQYDVNVHPTKAEVKFKDEQLLYRVVFHSVKDSMNTDEMIPSMSSSTVESEDPATLSMDFNQSAPHLKFQKSAGQAEPSSVSRFFDSETTDESQAIQSQLVHRRPAPHANSLVWQLHNRYIISQIKSGLAIIDQHVAHERILYEKALDAFDHAPIFSQQLLFPQTIELSAEDFSIFEEIVPMVDRLGFVVKKFGRRTIVVEAVPADVRLGNEQKILGDMIKEYKLNSYTNPDPRDNLAKSFSCKSAIKSGDPLTVEEMNGLIDQLFATKFPYVCPHGRPIVIQLSLDELDRRFMRT